MSSDQLKFEIQQKLDVEYRLGDNGWWYIGTIIDIKDEQIKVHYDYDGEDDEEDEWIDKTSNRLSKLYTHTLPIMHIPTQLSCDEYIHRDGKTPQTNAFYYKHDNNEYIIICNSHASIQKYNIQNATWIKICDFPDNCCPDKVCFDPEKAELHFLGESNVYYNVLNVKQIQWKTYSFNNTLAVEHDFDEFTFCFIPFTKEHLHLLYDDIHYKVIEDDDEFKMEKVESADDWADIDNVVCCDALQRLIALCSNFIWYYDINNKTRDKLRWRKYPIHIEIYSSRYLIIAYQHILFVFNEVFDKIYCIDLLHEKAYKSEREIPSNFSHNVSIVKGDNDYVYIINDNDSNPNIRISLFDVIPKSLYLDYQQNVYNPLVFGYIAEMTKTKELTVSVPFDIVNLIFVFMPIFCEM